MSAYRHVYFDPEGHAHGQELRTATGRWQDFTADPVLETIRRALDDDAIAHTMWELHDGDPAHATSADWSRTPYRDASPGAILKMYSIARQIVGPFFLARRWNTTLRDAIDALERRVAHYRAEADEPEDGAPLDTCVACGHTWWILADPENPKVPGHIALSDGVVVAMNGQLLCRNCNAVAA
jgi:hypothetical protein